MHVFKNGSEISDSEPLYPGEHIVIAIDSSKSNTAMIVGNTNWQILDDFEFNGSGKENDVYDVCRDTRVWLRKIFAGSIVEAVGIEDIVTTAVKNKGMSMHESRAKITAIFNNYVFSFEDMYGQRPIFINNQAWKSHTLPEEYRKRDHDKGSKDYAIAIGSRYAHRSDDITDAVCIFKYMKMLVHLHVVNSIKQTKLTTKNFSWYIVNNDFDTSDMEAYYIDNGDTLLHNIETIAEVKTTRFGYLIANLRNLSISDIYSHTLKANNNKFQMHTDKVKIVVE